MLRSTRRGLETWQGRNASTPAGAPVLDPTSLNLVGRPRSLISGSLARAGARTRDGGEVLQVGHMFKVG